MMRVSSLGSGSSGNATVVEAGSGTTRTRLLIDCGFSLRELQARLARAGLAAEDLDAVFVTHEHSDHVGCALALARRFGIALWTSRGTWRAIGTDADGVVACFARDNQMFEVGDLSITPYTVPHDAREPLQLTCSDGARKLGVLTDAGSATTHLLDHLQGCDVLLLECNHDPELLAASSYPPALKARVASAHGHLSNEAAAQILERCHHPRLQHVVAAHLSERNNRPELARAALAGAIGCGAAQIAVADRSEGLGWLSIA
jgi:phosphoribosyl 1,2-cyclic phosphodiesterase